MKQIKEILTILTILVVFSCKAQNIVPYESDQDIYVPNSGDYYKDTNNVFNNFVGEWKWENTNTNSSLTIVLRKDINIDSGENYTYDLLVGEYQYIENNEELVNTLNQMSDTNIVAENHKIQGIGTLTKYNYPQCDDCEEGERRMRVSIKHDQFDGVTGKLIMRYIVENGIEKLHVIVKDGPWLASDPNAPDFIDVPFGEYILVKQN